VIALPLAHGFAGVQDPPLPMWLVYYGASAVLVLSFAALGALWRRPLLEDERRRDATTVPRAIPILFGAVGVALFVIVFWAALAGERSPGTNLAPTFVWVVFWLGLVPLVLLLGNVWRWLNPWRAIADAVAWLTEKSGLDWEAPFAYPQRLGRWPAVLLLLAFAALELAWSDPSDPRALALGIAIYSWVTWVGAAAFGREAWFPNGDAFTVYFSLLSRLSLFALEGRRIAVRRALAGVARREEAPGTIAFVAVMLGSVAFDGFSRTTVWSDRLFGASEWEAVGMNVLALIGASLLVAAAFVFAIEVARRVGGARERLESAFVGSLIPIALAYTVAHYFSLLVLQGQLAWPLASDPFGYGWDLFGTIDYRVNVTPLSADAIWFVQTGALVVGHVLGLVIAHDRAVALFGTSRVALRTQYALLALMVLYTVGGLWLLSRG
jgi:hypothetical protein